MGQVTGIEWCHHTYNPWIGCTKVSPACDHCYAEAQEDARYGRVEWGGPRRRTSEATRRAPYRWDREAAAAGERRRVFCMSLGDFWDNQVPDEWRTEALNMIRQCRNLDWLILTKRPQNIIKMLPPDWTTARMVACLAWGDGGKHDRGATADSGALARARPHALAIGRAIAGAARSAALAWTRHRLDRCRRRDRSQGSPLHGTGLGARPARSVPRHRCLAVSQTDVEAASDPGRSDGARVSRTVKPFGAAIPTVSGYLPNTKIRRNTDDSAHWPPSLI